MTQSDSVPTPISKGTKRALFLQNVASVSETNRPARAISKSQKRVPLTDKVDTPASPIARPLPSAPLPPKNLEHVTSEEHVSNSTQVLEETIELSITLPMPSSPSNPLQKSVSSGSVIQRAQSFLKEVETVSQTTPKKSVSISRGTARAQFLKAQAAQLQQQQQSSPYVCVAS